MVTTPARNLLAEVQLSIREYQLLEELEGTESSSRFIARHAKDERLERLVVLDVLKKRANFQQKRSFLDGFRFASVLNHENLIKTANVSDPGRVCYAVSEFVPGGSLARVLTELERRKERLPVLIAVRLTLDLLGALHHLHTVRNPTGRPIGLAPGVLVPQHVFVGFDGLGRLQALDNLFFAPEQPPATPSSEGDVVAVGVFLWELICGRRAGRTATLPSTLLFRKDVDTKLDKVILAATQAATASMYGNCQGLAEALEQAAPTVRANACRRHVATVLQGTLSDDLARQLQWANQGEELERRPLPEVPDQSLTPPIAAAKLARHVPLSSDDDDATVVFDTAAAIDADADDWEDASSLMTDDSDGALVEDEQTVVYGGPDFEPEAGTAGASAQLPEPELPAPGTVPFDGDDADAETRVFDGWGNSVSAFDEGEDEQTVVYGGPQSAGSGDGGAASERQRRAMSLNLQQYQPLQSDRPRLPSVPPPPAPPPGAPGKQQALVDTRPAHRRAVSRNSANFGRPIQNLVSADGTPLVATPTAFSARDTQPGVARSSEALHSRERRHRVRRWLFASGSALAGAAASLLAFLIFRPDPPQAPPVAETASSAAAAAPEPEESSVWSSQRQPKPPLEREPVAMSDLPREADPPEADAPEGSSESEEDEPTEAATPEKTAAAKTVASRPRAARRKATTASSRSKPRRTTVSSPKRASQKSAPSSEKSTSGSTSSFVERWKRKQQARAKQ